MKFFIDSADIEEIKEDIEESLEKNSQVDEELLEKLKALEEIDVKATICPAI